MTERTNPDTQNIQLIKNPRDNNLEDSSSITMNVSENDRRFGDIWSVDGSNDKSNVNIKDLKTSKSDHVLRLSFDVKEYDRNSVKAKLIDHTLYVTAQLKKGRSINDDVEDYSRRFILPPGVNGRNMDLVLTKEGILEVIAPISNRKSEEIDLPITKLDS